MFEIIENNTSETSENVKNQLLQLGDFNAEFVKIFSSRILLERFDKTADFGREEKKLSEFECKICHKILRKVSYCQLISFCSFQSFLNFVMPFHPNI